MIPCMLRDWQWWAATAAGPVVWAALYLVLRPAFVPAWPLLHPGVFLPAALVYPVLEEIVFRGLIQDALARHVPNPLPGPLTTANVLSSVLFALMHLIGHTPLWAAAVFLPSLVFGYFRERHGLAAPIVLHVFYNAGYFWLLGAPSAL